MRQLPFLTDLGFTALNGVHRGVPHASEGHIGGSALGYDPDFTVAEQRMTARTRVAMPEEAVNLRPQVVAVYPPYGRYQRRSPRDIPLVLVEPR